MERRKEGRKKERKGGRTKIPYGFSGSYFCELGLEFMPLVLLILRFSVMK
jgi:hypothetical protein